MSTTFTAIVHNGKIEPLHTKLPPEGTEVLVSVKPDALLNFWQAASSKSLDAIWDNDEDDRYAELLEA